MMRFLLPRFLCKVLVLLRLDFYVLIWRVRALIGGLEIIASLIQRLQLSVCTTHLVDIFSAKMKFPQLREPVPISLPTSKLTGADVDFLVYSMYLYDETCLLGFVELALLALASPFHAKKNQQNQGIHDRSVLFARDSTSEKEKSS